MRKLCFGLALIFVSCSGEQKRGDEMIKVNASDLVDSVENVLELDDPILDSVYLLQIDSTYHFMNGYDTIQTITLSPMVNFSSGDFNNQTIQDEVYLMANCMIVLRGVHSLGDFCHTPSVESGEIYTLKGDSIQLGREAQSYLYGGLDSPDGEWAVITDGEEGYYYGFSIFKSNGSREYYGIDDFGYGENRGAYQVEFINDTTYLFENIVEGIKDNGADLVVYRSGDYEVNWPIPKEDTLDFYFFNEYEVWPHYSQAYWLYRSSGDTSYVKYEIDPRQTLKDRSQQRFFDLDNGSALVMFSGLSTSLSNTKLYNLNVDLKSGVLSTNDSEVLVHIDSSKVDYGVVWNAVKLEFQNNGKSSIVEIPMGLTYPGEVLNKGKSHFMADINGDDLLDLFLIFEGDLCRYNVVVLSGETGYEVIWNNEFCWD